MTIQDEEIDKLQPLMQLLSEEVAKIEEYAKAMKMIAVLLIHKQGGCFEIANSELAAFIDQTYTLETRINKLTDEMVLTVKKDGS
jgi:hypothetical protein